jgi:dTDP-glucose pyrophosphorylase/CBS domain-containing protein
MNSHSTDEALFVAPASSIRQAIARIDRNERGIVLVVDGEHRLLGTVTDGDVRRAMLANVDLDGPVSGLLARKVNPRYTRPITAPMHTPKPELLRLMHEHVVHQIPLVDAANRVVSLVTMDDLLPEPTLPLQAVVMAGGFGSRLAPLTDHTPKPMLEVGGRPLMERIIEQLQQAGICQVSVTTHYRPEVIKQHFGNGAALGVDLTYVEETSPMGTAGALSLIEAAREPLLVINGDILTEVNFRALLAYHQEHQAEMTVGVRRYDIQVPYGVIESDGAHVRGVQEKPQLSFFVNAGIYLLDPGARRFIPPGQFFNMTDLIQALIQAQRPVVSFPIREYWLDIGQHADYSRAQADLKNGVLSS